MKSVKKLSPKSFLNYDLFLSLIAIIFLVVMFLLPVVGKKTIGTGTLKNTAFGLIHNQDYRGFELFSKNNGVETAYKLLEEKFSKNETEAHDFAHVIGLAAYEQKGPIGLSVCDFAYAYGCFHGFIQGFLEDKGPEVISEIEKSCLAFGPIHSPSCLHGIGHGVLAYEGYDLGKSLSVCDNLLKKSQVYCQDGVFMERNIGSMQSADQKFKLTEDNLNEPCSLVKDSYKRQCYRNQVFAWTGFFKGDLAKVAGQCGSIETSYREICFQSLGIEAAMKRGNKSEIVSACKASGPFTDTCLEGAMEELMFEGKSPQIASDLCEGFSSSKMVDCEQKLQLLLADYKIRFKK